jgi:GTP cyclohydrolase II
MTLPSVTQTACARIPTAEGEFRLCHYSNNLDEKEHLALVLGDVAGRTDLLVRVHSECFTGDVLGSQRCDCGPQLHSAMRLIAEAGSGLIIYLRQEGRGIGLAEKLAAYCLQDQGYDTVDANLLLGHEADEREYWAAAGILQDLEVQSIRLLTNNPSKIEQLRYLGIEVTKRVPLETKVTQENAVYLATKVERMRHLLTLPEVVNGKPSAIIEMTPDIEQRISRLSADALAFSRHHRRPFVTLSYAQSLDGSIASASGKPLPISSPQSMVMTHALFDAYSGLNQ